MMLAKEVEHHKFLVQLALLTLLPAQGRQGGQCLVKAVGLSEVCEEPATNTRGTPAKSSSVHVAPRLL